MNLLPFVPLQQKLLLEQPLFEADPRFLDELAQLSASRRAQRVNDVKVILLARLNNHLVASTWRTRDGKQFRVVVRQVFGEID